MFRKLSPLVASLLILALAACSTQTPATSPTSVALEAFKPISASRQDTCPTQRAIAEHNSKYETLKAGKETVYKAACEVAKPKPPKTS